MKQKESSADSYANLQALLEVGEVIKGVRRHLCERCAELCDERWQPNDLSPEGDTGR